MQELFVPGDISILTRNQPVISKPDSWLWKFTRTGVYSVKTGYGLAFARNNAEMLRSQEAKPSLNPLKTQVWNLLAPPKIKVFLWKALSGALSVQDRLLDRGMTCDRACYTCGEDGESINHVLFSCTFARQVWALSNFPSPQGGFDNATVYENIHYLINTWRTKTEMKDITRIFHWTLWFLWKNRNSFLFDGILFDSEQVCAKSEEEASLWYVAQHLELRSMDDHRDQSFQASSAWIHPPESFVKCNIAYKWTTQKGIMGAAWVVRDASGTVLLHSRRSFGDVKSKDEVQFLSVAWAIESMDNLRYYKVHFAFEGRMLVEAINNPKAWHSFKFQVGEIRNQLRKFLHWRVLMEPYETNTGARFIATSAVMDLRYQSYVARVPFFWIVVEVMVISLAVVVCGAVCVCVNFV